MKTNLMSVFEPEQKSINYSFLVNNIFFANGKNILVNRQ